MSFRQLVASSVPKSLIRVLRYCQPSFRTELRLAACLPPIVCVDVGASYYPHPAWRLLRQSRNTSWVAVEPNAENLGYVREWKWPCKVSTCTTGLSFEGGPQTLYVTNVDSGSSLLEPVVPAGLSHRIRNLGYFFPVRAHTIETITLPEVISGQPQNAPLFIKLDTQGTELSILRAAESVFSRRLIVGVELEATMLAQPIMKGAGKFWEANQYLESHGFELVHIKPICGLSRLDRLKPRGRLYLNECDAVFAIRPDVASELPVDRRVALLAFYTCYRLFEEALHLLEADAEVSKYLESRGCDLRGLAAGLRSQA
jgi:FkbM family methyltransferase